MPIQTSDNKFGVAKWIVDPTEGLGTHTTIAGAITSASSGEDIFIRPGTYTENLTLKAGVNLIAMKGDEMGNVTIVGKATFTGTGTVNISNIRLQTNSDFLLAVTGSSASVVNLKNCYLNISNNTGISFTSSSSSASIGLSSCAGNVGTTGITIFSHSSSGSLGIDDTGINNTGGATTASTISAGSLTIQNSDIYSPITSSGSATLSISYSFFSAANATNITHGSSTEAAFNNCIFVSGTASAISVSNTCTISLRACTVQSQNANIITGAGTANIDGIFTAGSTGVVNATIGTTGQRVYVPAVSFDGGTNNLANFVNTTSWTPTLRFGGGSTGITYSTQTGSYFRIGPVIFFSFTIALTNKGSSTGAATVAGLPVTVGTSPTCSGGAFTITYTAGYSSVILEPAAATTTLNLNQAGSGVAYTNLTNTNFANTSLIGGSGFYYV